MAYKMTKQGSLDNEITYEFFCDTAADMESIEAQYRTLGSIAIVLEGESGGLEIYITNSSREWMALNITSGSGDDSSSGVGFNVEIVNSLPSEDISEGTIYFLAKNGSQGDSYDEYMYINNNWEKIGNTSIDLSNYATKSEIPDVSGFYTKPSGGIPAADLADTYLTAHQDISGLAPKASPVFTGSISMGRKTNTTVGQLSTTIGQNGTASGYGSYAAGNNCTASVEFSCAEGNNTTASGFAAHAEGQSTTASSSFSHAEGISCVASNDAAHAEGNNTVASGPISHAEGMQTIASGENSHAEGISTNASGMGAHAEGISTIATKTGQHTSGVSNIPDEYNSWTEWSAGTSYTIGDKVKITTISDDITTVNGYICNTANSDLTFTSSKWNLNTFGEYVEIVGNGITDNTRSNARVLDWDGNEKLMGDIYVGCNSDSTGGIKLARIPAAPISNGTYILQATVTNGTPTYSWISLSSLSGVTF